MPYTKINPKYTKTQGVKVQFFGKMIDWVLQEIETSSFNEKPKNRRAYFQACHKQPICRVYKKFLQINRKKTQF